jgi:hypothetical protein
MVRGFMGHNKRDLMAITRICDQGKRESDDWTPLIVKRLKRICRLVWAVIHNNQEITVQPARPVAAFPLGDGFKPINDVNECPRHTTFRARDFERCVRGCNWDRHIRNRLAYRADFGLHDNITPSQRKRDNGHYLEYLHVSVSFFALLCP